MTGVPYEKGALFVRSLEQAFGRPRLDAFLRDYFNDHRFESITTNEFESYLTERLLRHDAQAAQVVDLTLWLRRPGLPLALNPPTSTRLEAIDRAAVLWQQDKLQTDKLGARCGRPRSG